MVRPAEVLTQNILSSRGRTIRPKTVNQKTYVDAIDRNTITFGIGPAGTGKTYLAMAKAVQALQGKQVNRIVLTRPAVEAGERLGFLPGTLSEKIDPYLRPLYDALIVLDEAQNTSTEQMKMFLTRLGFDQTGDGVGVDHVVQGVVEGAQVGVDLLAERAGQEPEPLPRLDRRPGQHDPVDLLALQGLHRLGHGQVRLAGAGRSDPEGDRVPV